MTDFDMYLMHDGQAVARWHCADAIHRWFEDRSYDRSLPFGVSMGVTHGELAELRDSCRAVLADVDFGPVVYFREPLCVRAPNGLWEEVARDGFQYVGRRYGRELVGASRERAVALMPNDLYLPAGGGCYGVNGNPYDEGYVKALSETVRQLDPVLSEFSDGSWFTYFAVENVRYE